MSHFLSVPGGFSAKNIDTPWYRPVQLTYSTAARRAHLSDFEPRLQPLPSPQGTTQTHGMRRPHCSSYYRDMNAKTSRQDPVSRSDLRSYTRPHTQDQPNLARLSSSHHDYFRVLPISGFPEPGRGILVTGCRIVPVVAPSWLTSLSILAVNLELALDYHSLKLIQLFHKSTFHSRK